MPYLRPDGVLCDYAVPFATIAMDDMPPALRARKNKPNGTTPMPTRRPAMARDASPDDQDALLQFLATKLEGADLAQARRLMGTSPGAEDDNSELIAKLKAACRGVGMSDEEIEAVCQGTPIATDDPPPFPGRPRPGGGQDPIATAQDSAFGSRWGDGAAVSAYGMPCRSREMAADASAAAGFDRRWGRLCGERA